MCDPSPAWLENETDDRRVGLGPVESEEWARGSVGQRNLSAVSKE